MKRKMIDIIKNEEQLGKIKLEFPIIERIILKIEAIETYRRVFLFNLYKKIVTSVSVMLVLIVGILFFKREKGQKVLITYPYNGETIVEVIGSFNNWERKVPMQLDEDKRIWKVEILIKNKRIIEYQLVIDKLIYTTGDTIYKIKDKNGNEKAILSI